MQRQLRRCALLLFPEESLNPETIDQIASEGFTDVGVAVFMSRSTRHFSGQGFSVEQGRRLAELAEERKLGLLAFTGHMKYQEDVLQAEPERAMITVSGDRALESDGLPSSWLCPFRPENKKCYLELLLDIAQWPALREIHLNDEASLGFTDGAIGCYCDYCCREFKRAFGTTPPRRPDWDDPLWWQWIQYRMDSWVALHSQLREQIKAVRPDVAVGIQHSPLPTAFWDNPWRSAISLAKDAEAMDVLATDPYHFIHYSYFPYRPHRRILTEATRTLLRATVKRSANIYTQAFAPPGNSLELGRQDGLLAGIVPFALGADTITPYAYELMKIIPEFFQGLQDARRLVPYFEKTRPWWFATVLNPLQSEVYGHPKEAWGRKHLTAWAELMNRVGSPWRWLSDQRLEDAADSLTGPSIVPEAHCLTSAQLQVIQQLVDRGEGVLWVGSVPQNAWTGHGPCPLPSPAEEGYFEVNLKPNNHPVLAEVQQPVLLASRVHHVGLQGEVLGTVAGEPAIVVRQESGRKQVWYTGRPVFSYVRPQDHGSVRTPTGGAALLRNTLRWLSPVEPMIELYPFPPPNAYGRLRPSDKRDVPTMELLPLVGEQMIVAIIFHYMRLAYETTLILRLPKGTVVDCVEDLWTSHDLERMVEVSGSEVRLPLRITPKQELVAMAVRWK